jgi:pimeloyl-ACP methyl ester carboxylesterase
MKKILLAIYLICIASTALNAQSLGMFGQKIDISAYKGKKFVLEASVKAEMLDESKKNGTAVWVKFYKEKSVAGSEYFSGGGIRVNEWKQYSIKDKIDDDAVAMIIGAEFMGKGIYTYDNFKLSIKINKHEKIEIPILDGDLENDSIPFKKSWPLRMLPKGFTMQKVDSNSFSGKHCIQVDGSKVIKVTSWGDNDSTGKYAFVNGIKLYYETYGQGEPLLLLHGNHQSIEVFSGQINTFAKTFKVIAVDTRGQGKSNEDGKRYSYDLFAEDMNSLLNELKIDSANIIGWSDGGNTGLIMAIKYPKKVKKLITMGANVFINETDVVVKEILDAVKKSIQSSKKDTTYESRNSVRLLKMLLEEPRHSFEDLKRITCPVLVIAGEKDMILEKHTKGIAANIKNSILLIAPKQTHFYPEENAPSFNEVVLKFLNEPK